MEKEALLCSDDADEMVSQKPKRCKAGLITMPFIIANEALARMASLGLLSNMILYLMGSYKLHLGQATQMLLLSSAASNFMPVVGAFVADSYLGRFLVVGLGSAVSFLGMTLLWLTAMIPAARPPACDHLTEGCKSATKGQIAMLLSAFGLMSIGNGGRSCSLAFGVDQVNRKYNPNNHRVLEIFFSSYYAFTTISVIIALTVIVYIQDHLGWKIGFGIPAALMLFSTLLFFLASPLYVKITKRTSLFTGFAQVTVAAYKNRKLSLPPKNSPEFYHHNKDSDLVVPTDKLRFLNKACVIKEHEQVIASDGSAINPWRLCTVDQVEELKAIVRVIPLWSTGIMMSLNIGGSFGLLQAKSLDRHITSHFEVPAGSFSVIMVAALFIWIVLYDRVLIPLASNIRGKPIRISAKRRMGIGLLVSFLHLVTAATFETIRRKKAIKEGYLNDTHGVLKMSALWLAPQLCLGGIAEAFNGIGQNEFYYTEFPKTMSSVAASLSGLGMVAGNLVSSFVFITIENVTLRGGKEAWISDNINKGRFDKYYWVIAGFSALNLLYYLVCSWAYGPTVDEVSKCNSSSIEVNKKARVHPSSSQPPLKCNSSTVGINKTARVLPSSSQPPLKVRKKLSDIMTEMHQLVVPFGKTDTATVLYEAILYIKFLHSQVEVHVFPEDPSQLLDDSGLKRKGAPIPNQIANKAKNLRSRGLCLVPMSSLCHAHNMHVGSANGAEYL